MARNVTVRLDLSNLRLQATRRGVPVPGHGGLAEQSLRRAAGTVRDRTKRNITNKGRVDNGRMRQSVDYHITNSIGNRLTAEVGIYVSYADYQENGTANQGTGFIYPRRAHLLRFKPSGGGAFVFAKRVHGVKPGYFLRDAMRSLSAEDFRI